MEFDFLNLLKQKNNVLIHISLTMIIPVTVMNEYALI